jgi:hypothetical protein
MTPSAPAASWSSTLAAHVSAEPTAAGSQSSGMSVAMCWSCSTVATASMAPGTERTTSSARNRSRGAGSQPFIVTSASP